MWVLKENSAPVERHRRVSCLHQRCCCRTNESRHEKTNVLVSDLVRHKPGCKATEDVENLEISDLESRGIVLSM